jgi:ABC-type polysaccharide/polyol phosphate transport system ATPase subunit
MSAAVVIRAENLTKVYRLYAKPSYRFRDIFGLLGNKAGAFTEHAALAGVSLEIRRGEKVAIIGRNGAGKSTFLKLVTNVIQPTSGTLEVTGSAHALLQIGTGFHPEFTGRENVYAYFAQLGVTGGEANQRCADVIEFAELEEYIDQPMKTYSTGMAVRLMFSASTAIKPDLLVLDEVLGVGDAYFAHKSYDRIKDLCDRHGSTAILVTHDIYTAVKICSRVIWIDSGRIVFDGEGSAAVRAYEDSIRQQEERRLRARKQEGLRKLRAGSQAGHGHVLLEIATADQRPPASPVYFSRIALRRRDREIGSLPLEASEFDDQAPSHLQREATAWGDPIRWHGRAARPFLNYGSAFPKIAGVAAIDAAADDSADDLVADLEYWSDDACELVVRGFVNGRVLAPAPLQVRTGEWIRTAVALPASRSGGASPDAAAINTAGVHGTGRIAVTNAAFLDANGDETLVLEHGRAATLAIGYRVVDPALPPAVQVVVAWHRDGVQDVCRMFSRELRLAGAGGTIRLEIDRLGLTDGRYSITIMIAEPGYYDRSQALFYAINPGVFCCLSRLFDVDIVKSGLIGSGTFAVDPAKWSVQ